MPITKFTWVVFVVSLACATVFGQSGVETGRLQNFHIHGTIRSNDTHSVLAGAEITFKGEKTSKAVTADTNGFYQTDLAPGLYTMSVKSWVRFLQIYERPLFRATPSADYVLDINVEPERQTCDLVTAVGSQHVLDENDSLDLCGGEKFFPAPSEDGVPFQLLIRYSRRESDGQGYIYLGDLNYSTGPSYVYRSGSNPPALSTPVFVAYNLLTLRADRVVYDVQTRTLDAKGRVVTINEKGETQHADSMTLRIQNGEATPLH